MKASVILSVIATSASIIASANAAAVTAGNVVVFRVGDGSAALTNASTAAYLDEYTRAGVNAQSVAIATSGVGRLTVSGSATSEGQITLNNGYLGVAGYDVGTGTASVASSASTAIARRYSGYNVAGDLATASPAVTGTTTLYSGNNIRSVTTDGTNSYGAGGNSGTVLLPSTVVEATPANTRVVNAFNGNLYFSTGSGTTGIYGFTGTPTSTSTATLLIANASPYSFSFSPTGDVAYVANDSATGGVSKYTLSNGVYTLAYTISLDGDGAGTAQAAGARGLAVDYAAVGGPTIFATSAETINRLVSFVDTGAASTIATLQTAAANTAFRGVVVTPAGSAVPEPASLAALGSLAVVVGLRRRRRA